MIVIMLTLSKSIIGLTLESSVDRFACNVNDFLPGKSVSFASSLFLDATILGVDNTLLLCSETDS